MDKVQRDSSLPSFALGGGGGGEGMESGRPISHLLYCATASAVCSLSSVIGGKVASVISAIGSAFKKRPHLREGVLALGKFTLDLLECTLKGLRISAAEWMSQLRGRPNMQPSVRADQPIGGGGVFTTGSFALLAFKPSFMLSSARIESMSIYES